MAAIGVNPSWEQFRAKHKDMHINAQSRYKNGLSVEPGQILTCGGSLHDTFYRHLASKGFRLDAYELQAVKRLPRRYCIVNRRIHDQEYEVFLMTTFSGARNVDHIAGLPRLFGMPIGKTNFNDIPGLTVIPPMMGVNKSSFVFAIPAVVPFVEPSEFLPVGIRVPPGELNRLRKFSQERLRMLPEHQRALRKELKTSRERAAYADIQDDFKPIARRLPSSTEEDYDDMERFIPTAAIVTSRFKPKRLTLPEHNDINWLLRHASKDINLSKSLQWFLHRPPRIQSFSLPKPYYTSRLPISLKNFWRTIR